MKRFIFLIILGCLAYFGWKYRGQIQAKITDWRQQQAEEQRPKPEIQRYHVMCDDLAERRKQLLSEFQQSSSLYEQGQILNKAQTLLDAVLPEMMRCWIGTPWDFNGTAKQPGNDPIACGYFVSTVLKNAGFRLERYKLAQQPSTRIIQTFLPKSAITTTVGDRFDKFLKQMSRRASGIYLVGLDKHVGFIENNPNGIRFLHSSGGFPYHVVDEDKDDAKSLKNSKFRVVGHLTGDKEVLHAWLVGDDFPTKLGSR